MIDRWGALVARRALAVLLTAVVVTLGAGAYGLGVFDHLSQGGFEDPSSETSRELDAERAAFGNRQADVVAIYSSDTLTADDPAFRSAVSQAVGSLGTDLVVHAVAWYDAPDAGLVSEDRHSAQVIVSLAGETQDDYLTAYDEVAPALETAPGSGVSTELTGNFAVYHDVNTILEGDLARAEAISLPLVVILALLIFSSLVAASMPALVGVVATLGALAVVRLLTQFTDVSVFSVNVISLLGIGLAIDYALFVISRFREELELVDGTDPDGVAHALRRTMATAGRTVLFSGLTVAAALASLLIFPQTFLRSMGYGGMAAVLVAMLAALTVLPATLRLLGPRIDAGRIHRGRLPGRRGSVTAVVADGQGRWAALARTVMKRPLLIGGATVVLLLAVASPFLGATWGSVDYRVLPSDAPSRIAADRLNDFGPETSSANLLVSGASPADVAAYAEGVGDVAGVVDVTPVTEPAVDGTTLLRATWRGNSQTPASQDIVRAIRDVDPASGQALVGGLTADTVDLVASVGDHLPWMGLIVVAVMLVLLFLAFGSVVLPVKAVVMNLFSITASFGVVTWIFADGHLAGLLGFEAPGYLDATNPILMLAILFGLSMDYEVFLLSRVREQWDASVRRGQPDNDLAVATGVQKTGRIITSAALLLAIVIGAFGTSGVVFMKLLGIGMLVALAVDATLVRAVLVPATMKLLGRWNWWAPGPLARWWERHGFHVDSAARPAVEADGVRREPATRDVELVETRSGV